MCALRNRYVASQLAALAPWLTHSKNSYVSCIRYLLYHNFYELIFLFLFIFSIELCILAGTVFRLSWEVLKHRSGVFRLKLSTGYHPFRPSSLDLCITLV